MSLNTKHFGLNVRYYLLTALLFYNLASLLCQNAIVGSGFSSGWGGGSCPTGNSNFTYFGPSLGGTFTNTLQANGTGNQYFRFGIDWNTTTAQRTISIGSDIAVLPTQKYTLNSSCTTAGAMYIQVSNTSNRYVFKTRNGGTNPQGDFVVFELGGEPSQVTSVIPSPRQPEIAENQATLVKAILNNALPTGQGVYLRYSVDNWATSNILNMSGIGLVRSASIPGQTSGTVVKYYVFTSGANININHIDADLFSINANTNGGSNYSYTVTNTPNVSVNPSYPNTTQSITITFNATGTALAGASKVYLHGGASTNYLNPTSFNHVTGNWGQDDGVGEMMPIPNQTDQWQITLNGGCRAYFNINNTEDIFGLNFLFRNASGTIKVDNNEMNYHNAIDPGHYFLLSAPSQTMQAVQSGTTFEVKSESTVAPTMWILKDSTTSPPIVLHTQAGGSSYNYSLLMPDTQDHTYRLEAQYATGKKHKTFHLIGFLPPAMSSRPSGMKLGVNYHPNDATKVTLILHAPTYTRYKKGTGVVSGTGTTPPKNVVYVIGDFNNWTPSEAYKLNRDTDGWNGSTDSDNDGDRGDYWWITLTGLMPGQAYVFQYLIDGNLQVGDPYTEQVSDFDDIAIPSSVYPNLISYPPQAVDRASVFRTNASGFSWTAPPFMPPAKKDLNIYELLIRDFTDEGTYLATIDRLDYIKGLGINAIHIMPVSEFEGNSSWGYNPNFYFASDKAYGPAYQLKKLIDECHKREILVFNDLVLNHAFYSNVMAKMYWDPTFNRPASHNPWFNATHKMVRNPAGHWGVDWNHESEHTQNMVDSILGYWLSEFKFDGFRFDFTKGFGQTNPDDFPPGDDWASSYNQDRIDLLKRMVDRMWLYYPGSIAIFEHLADVQEDRVLANHGILMWSGVGHHNAIKNFILGYNSDNPNIYDSGVYNTSSRNFAQPHWMSYGESHDEERLGYELMQYFNGPKTTANMIDRLKIAYGFNLLLPGPRMLWQFGELGYEVSINYNGRTGEKPTYWSYYDDAKRRELYTFISRILKIRSKYNIYSTPPDYDNIGLGAGNIHIPRVMRFSSNNGKHVIVCANIDPNTGRNVTPNFDVPGTWYRYNGVLDEAPYVVTNLGSNYVLAPSEIVVFTNFIIDDCTDIRSDDDSGPYSLRNAIDCAIDGATIECEYPVFGDTITLQTPIVIDKNITIKGFFGRNIHIQGNGFNQSIFTIESGKVVTIDGISLLCSSGNNEGRCLVNYGNLTLANTLLFDDSLSNSSMIINQGNATLSIEKNVDIVKE